jgi:hypothetical protein
VGSGLFFRAALVWLICPTLAPRAGNIAHFPFRGADPGVEFRSGRMGRGGGELAPERPVVVRIPLTARLGGFEAPGAEGPVFVHVPAGDHSGADHEVAEPGHTVGGVCFEGEFGSLTKKFEKLWMPDSCASCAIVAVA